MIQILMTHLVGGKIDCMRCLQGTTFSLRWIGILVFYPPKFDGIGLIIDFLKQIKEAIPKHH